MTLGTTRENGLRSLAITFGACHHQAVVDVSAFADEELTPKLSHKKFRDLASC